VDARAALLGAAWPRTRQGCDRRAGSSPWTIYGGSITPKSWRGATSGAGIREQNQAVPGGFRTAAVRRARAAATPDVRQLGRRRPTRRSYRDVVACLNSRQRVPRSPRHGPSDWIKAARRRRVPPEGKVSSNSAPKAALNTPPSSPRSPARSPRPKPRSTDTLLHSRTAHSTRPPAGTASANSPPTSANSTPAEPTSPH
jgi:hypothetical protein